MSKPPREAKNTCRFTPSAWRTDTSLAIISIWSASPVFGKTVVNVGAASSAEASRRWLASARLITSFQAPSKRFTLGTASMALIAFETGSVPSAL